VAPLDFPALQVYETPALLDMYLGLHFPASGEGEGVPPLLPHASAPAHALRFPQRCAELLEKHAPVAAAAGGAAARRRALDVGCAVGGASFELAKTFDDVVGFDFSKSFITAANAMKAGEDVRFMVPVEGDCSVEVRQVGQLQGTASRHHFLPWSNLVIVPWRLSLPFLLLLFLCGCGG